MFCGQKRSKGGRDREKHVTISLLILFQKFIFNNITCATDIQMI